LEDRNRIGGPARAQWVTKSESYVAFADTETGECGERRLNHREREAEKFYRELKQRGVSVRVGMEATGYSRWFERLLAELRIEVWMATLRRLRGNESASRTLGMNRATHVLHAVADRSLVHI